MKKKLEHEQINSNVMVALVIVKLFLKIPCNYIAYNPVKLG